MLVYIRPADEPILTFKEFLVVKIVPFEVRFHGLRTCAKRTPVDLRDGSQEFFGSAIRVVPGAEGHVLVVDRDAQAEDDLLDVVDVGVAAENRLDDGTCVFCKSYIRFAMCI